MQFVVPFLASTAQQRYTLFVLYSNADIFSPQAGVSDGKYP